jgi:hypothetical protein
MYLTSVFRFCRMFILTIASVLAFSTLGMAQAYHQTNFVSDIAITHPKDSSADCRGRHQCNSGCCRTDSALRMKLPSVTTSS